VNRVGWLVYQGDHAWNPRWTLHTEYQWRRDDFLKNWQQSLARVGLAYSLNDKVTVSAGYTNLITYPYGDYPEADAGKPNIEHRLYEDIELDDTTGRLALNHRFRLEQRWAGAWEETATGRQLDWQYLNRIRYRIKASRPLRQTDSGKGIYVTFYDEVFIGFGRNVGLDVFDQNRIYLALGYSFTKALRLEAGYLNQITQHAEPEPVTQKPIFEHNHGLLVNVYFDLDFTK
jgi:hypothetical protein